MKKSIRWTALALSVCLLFAAFCIPSFAAPVTEVTYLEDGTYVVTTITEDSALSLFGMNAERTKSGTKKQDYYNSSDELMFSFTVHGTFTYDGSSAEASDADYSYKIYNSAWSFTSASASCSGATATATGRFKQGILSSRTATVRLTCSAKGTLS